MPLNFLNFLSVIIAFLITMFTFALAFKSRLLRKGTLFLATGLLFSLAIHAFVELLESFGAITTGVFLEGMPVLIIIGSIFLAVGGIQTLRHVTRPLKVLTNAIRGFSSPQLPFHLDPSVRELPNELGDLAQNFQEMADNLKSSTDMLVRSEQLAAIGQLATGVAHEINNPVGFIASNTEILGQYITDYTKVIRMAGRLKESVDRENIPEAKSIAREMARMKEEINLDYIMDDTTKLLRHNKEGLERIQKIVTDLRAFGREDKDVIEQMKVEDVIEGALNIVHNEIKYKAKLEKNYGDTPLIECNPQRLGQVFINLFINAVQAIKEKGTIEVKTYRRDKYVCVDIRDTGEGIAPEHINKIFDPFFTTKPAGQGTGLGLSVSYKIVKNHGGEMRVASRAGQGTTFTVLLPVT